MKKLDRTFRATSHVLPLGCTILLGLGPVLCKKVMAQEVLFEFNSAPLSSPLPIDQTVSGITAHFSATGDGYSIQNANTMGFTPQGFDGRCIYPSSINLSDLLVGFDHALTHFSIMYSCQELGCDDAATMRVTAFFNGTYVGTNTKTASSPGAWPVDTLGCSFQQGFDSVVVHYDSHPPTCQDYGVIYLADNMRITPTSGTNVNHQTTEDAFTIVNPVSATATVLFSLSTTQHINIVVYDIAGKPIASLVDGTLDPGPHQINWNVRDAQIDNGVYLMRIADGSYLSSCKLIVLK